MQLNKHKKAEKQLPKYFYLKKQFHQVMTKSITENFLLRLEQEFIYYLIIPIELRVSATFFLYNYYFI